MKSVRIRNFSGPYFPTIGLNTEKCFVSVRIHAEYGKIQTRETPNMETFHAVDGLFQGDFWLLKQNSLKPW